MVRTFCTSGQSEAIKGAVHAAGGALATLMVAYNVAAWCYRHERHLAINVVVYSLAVGWEVAQTLRHFERCVPASEPQLGGPKTKAA